jgi:hypothetical protein
MMARSQWCYKIVNLKWRFEELRAAAQQAAGSTDVKDRSRSAELIVQDIFRE